MRKALISFLLAGALAPAAALAQDLADDRGVRNESDRPVQYDSKNGDRPQRVEPPQRFERAERPDRVERAQRADRTVDTPATLERAQRIERTDRGERSRRPDRVERAERPDRADRPLRTPVQEAATQQPVQQAEGPAVVHRENRRPDSLVDGFREAGRDMSAGRTGGRSGHDTRDRDRGHDRDWDSDHRNRDRDHRSRRHDHDRDWSHKWRNDHRYDWWEYRKRHSSLFRVGRYYDPYGWGYRRWPVGYSLWPNYYGANYWLNDPWMYRLPSAYGPYRWVRYYDDALLVNIYTGHVVDVVYNFFW
jgi:hypothetical protein